MSVLVAVCSAFDWSCFGSLMGGGGAFIFGRNSSTFFFFVHCLVLPPLPREPTQHRSVCVKMPRPNGLAGVILGAGSKGKSKMRPFNVSVINGGGSAIHVLVKWVSG